MKFFSITPVAFLLTSCVVNSNAESIGNHRGIELRLRRMKGRIFWPQPSESKNHNRRSRREMDSFLEIEDYSLVSAFTSRRLRENLLSHKSIIRNTRLNRIGGELQSHKDRKRDSAVSKLLMHKINARPFSSRSTPDSILYKDIRSGQCDFDSECRWYCLLCHPLYRGCKCIDGMCECS